MQRQGSIGGSAENRVRATGGVLLVAHLALVAWLMLRPLDVPWVMPANLRPFAGIRADLELGAGDAARRIAEGLGLLAPLGVLLPMAHGRLTASPLLSLARTAATGALISVGIALLQTGVPGRVVDVDTMLLNTLGVALAHCAFVPAGRAWLRRRCGYDRLGAESAGNAGAAGGTGRTGRAEGGGEMLLAEDAPQGRTPTIPRVGIAP